MCVRFWTFRVFFRDARTASLAASSAASSARERIELAAPRLSLAPPALPVDAPTPRPATTVPPEANGWRTVSAMQLRPEAVAPLPPPPPPLVVVVVLLPPALAAAGRRSWRPWSASS